MSYAQMLDAMLAGEDLATAPAQTLMDTILRGEMESERLAGLLVALRAKGVCADELVGFATSMRQYSSRIDVPGTFDNCGTGGSPVKTFNISTIASFVIAAADVKVAKHGNRSITRPSGSADLLERAGARLDLEPDACRRVLDEAGIAFLFAPTFHPAMRHAGPVRQALGIKTVFNLLGPLTNPAGAERQVLGVYDPDLVPVMAEALARLGCRTGYVLHGMPGMDEATPCGPVLAAPILDGHVQGEVTIDPASLGIEPCEAAAIEPVPADEAPDLMRRILTGEPGPRSDTVALNAAFGLVAAGKAPDLPSGIALARDILNAGSGMAKCEAFIEATCHG